MANVLAGVLQRQESELLQEWKQELGRSSNLDVNSVRIQEQAQQFLSLLRSAAESGGFSDLNGFVWENMRGFLGELSRDRAYQGYSPTDTALFVLSLKEPLFRRLRSQQTEEAFDAFLETNRVLDRLALFTTEIFQKSREEVILRQQSEMLELSTPVVKLWDGILALPLIGTLDSARTQVVMESLLRRIVETNSQVAIIDITGVPTVDTLVAQHLIKTVTAARLMGADCIISGIRPQIAQTIVHLGVTLADVTTKASMADAFLIALQRMGFAVHKPTVRRS